MSGKEAIITYLVLKTYGYCPLVDSFCYQLFSLYPKSLLIPLIIPMD